MYELSKVKVLQALYAYVVAIRSFKKIEQIFNARCCGCKIAWDEYDCMMLTRDQMIEMYFDEALGCIDVLTVEKDLQGCVNVLIPKQKDRWLFFWNWCRDPRIDGEWKERVKSCVRDIANF